MSGVEIYRARTVQDVCELHHETIHRRTECPIGVALEERVDRLVQAHRVGDPRCACLLNNWCRELVGKPTSEVLAFALKRGHAEEATAREHGWSGWQQVAEHGHLLPDAAFEEAVDLLLGGDFAALRARIDCRPTLVDAASRYGHGATLLHYAAANGVETERQQTPSNLAQMIDLLLARGADPRRRARIYGGSTALQLLASSAHPAAAGVAEECLELLRATGGSGRAP